MDLNHLILAFAKYEKWRYHKEKFQKLSGEQIDPACCGVAVGWASPGCAAAAKGDGVHVLKGHLSWVQNGVSQFGLYLLEVFPPEGKEG